MKVYWQHNLFMHFKSWSVCISLRLLPLGEWKQWHGTKYRMYKKAETLRLGPLEIAWFNRDTSWEYPLS